MVEEKRRRRAAEQSLAELAGRLSRLRSVVDRSPPGGHSCDAAEPSAAADQPNLRPPAATPRVPSAGCKYCGGLASCAGQDVDAPAASAFTLDTPITASSAAHDNGSRFHGGDSGDDGISPKSASSAGAAVERLPPHNSASSTTEQAPCQVSPVLHL